MFSLRTSLAFGPSYRRKLSHGAVLAALALELALNFP
jgi:hypothetical protein